MSIAQHFQTQRLMVFLAFKFFTFFLLFPLFQANISAQMYTCTDLAICREYNGAVRKKSYAVSGLYLKFTPDSIKVFGNYSGRFISNVLKITSTSNDTIYADGGFFKSGTSISIVIRNNILTSNYNFIDNAGESKVSILLTLKPGQNQFSEKHHEQKELQQSRPLRRDLLGREHKN